MAAHSFIQCWLHIIWSTLNQQKILTENARRATSQYLYNYSKKLGVYMRINSVNPDHVHILITLPFNKTIEEILQAFKGSSSHWINQNDLLEQKFAWEKGYAAFSVSHSKVQQVVDFIANQEKYHWDVTFEHEYKSLIEKHGFSFVRSK